MVNEIINNNIYNFPKKLPYITVSAKGISNGLSTIINDGADFGPDTYLNTSSKNRIGPPYSQTSGIQEAINYAISSSSYSSDLGYIFYPIKLLSGNFEFSTPITYGIGNYSPSENFNINIEGSGITSTILTYTGTGTAITINPNINYINLGNFTLDNPNSTANYMIYWNGAKNGRSSLLNVSNIYNVYGPSSYLLYFNNVFIANIKNVISNSSFYGLYINGIANNVGSLYLSENLWTLQMDITVGNFEFVNISGVSTSTGIIINNPIFALKISQLNGGIIFNAEVYSTLIENSNLGGLNNSPALIINSNLPSIKILSSNVSGILLGSTNTTNNYTINILSIDSIYNDYIVSEFSNTSNVIINAYDIKNIPSGTYTSMPTQSTTNGTTGGTIFMDAVEYRLKYKKYIITFNNYENNTSSNQVINYPLPFNSFATIISNNTGLTISTTISGITITSPNNTTTYNGIVIVEGY